MAEVCAVQVIWNRERPVTPANMKYRAGEFLINVRFFPAYVDPEPEHPVGQKGLVLASMWKAVGGGADGMLIKDGDVAIDPHHLALMMECITDDPESVWTAPARIWPVSTHRPDWIWAHWADHGSQEVDDEARFFSFCFTYIPKSVIQAAARRGLRSWAYPRVDVNMSRAAQAVGVKGRVVPGCYPVHTHY